MTTTILTRHQFDSDTDGARKAADDGPVIITHRGQRSHVLLTIDEYERLAQQQDSIADRLALAEDVDFEPARLPDQLVRAADLS